MQIKKLAASILSCTMAAALLATGISPAPISMKSSAASSECLLRNDSCKGNTAQALCGVV